MKEREKREERRERRERREKEGERLREGWGREERNTRVEERSGKQMGSEWVIEMTVEEEEEEMEGGESSHVRFELFLPIQRLISFQPTHTFPRLFCHLHSTFPSIVLL